MQSGRRVIRKLGAALLLPSVWACGEAPEGQGEGAWDEVAVSAEAIGEATCLTAQPDAQFVVLRGPNQLISPTLYNHPSCSKAYVAESSAAFENWVNARMFVGWADMWPRTRTQCVGGKLTIQLMSKPASGGSYRSEGTFERALTWDEQRQECQYPELGIIEQSGVWKRYWGVHTPTQDWDEAAIPLTNSLSGRRVKIAASARTPRGTTQPLRIYWANP